MSEKQRADREKRKCVLVHANGPGQYYFIFQTVKEREKMANLTDLEDFEVFDQEDGLIVTAYTVMSAGEFMNRLN